MHPIIIGGSSESTKFERRPSICSMNVHHPGPEGRGALVCWGKLESLFITDYIVETPFR